MWSQLLKIQMNIASRILAALSVTLLCACASSPYKQDQSASFAMNVAVASGLTYRHSGPLSDKEIDEDELEGDTNWDDTLTSAYLASTSSVGSFDFSIWSAAALFSFLEEKKKHPAARTQFIAWMPSGNQTSEEAYKQYVKVIENAYEKTLPDGYRLKKALNVYDATFVSDIEQPMYLVVGPGCEDIETSLLEDRTIRKRHLKREKRYCILTHTEGNTDPERLKAPDWLGGGDAFVWGEFSGYDVDSASFYIRPPFLYYNEINNGEHINGFSFIKTMSGHLPDWAYIYVGPHRITKRGPLVLNKGAPHYFVKVSD